MVRDKWKNILKFAKATCQLPLVEFLGVGWYVLKNCLRSLAGQDFNVIDRELFHLKILKGEAAFNYIEKKSLQMEKNSKEYKFLKVFEEDVSLKLSLTHVEPSKKRLDAMNSIIITMKYRYFNINWKQLLDSRYE